MDGTTANTRLLRLAGHLTATSACTQENLVSEATASAPRLAKSYDFIVVGAGSAGCVVASRLSENPNVSVLLVEAGESNQTFVVRSPFITCPFLQNSSRDWAFRSTVQKATDDRISHWPRGKTLGGCSSINYMLYVRGDPRNYDQWCQEHGCEGWSYKEVLPYFLKSENYISQHGDPSVHGTGGPLHVSHGKDTDFVTKDVTERFVKSCEAAGLPTNPDYNGNQQDGASLSQLTIKNGVRCDTASAFLYRNGAINRPNLTVVTNYLTSRIVFQGKRAVGVALRNLKAKAKSQPDIIITANKEVVVSCGAVQTPQLLMLSGIGPADHLKEHDIECIADLPVGQNLQDHLFAPVMFPFKKGYEHLGFYDKSFIDIAKLFGNYMMGTGMACISWVTGMSFLRSGLRKEEDGNDLQVHFVPLLPHDQKQAEKNFGVTVRADRALSDMSKYPSHGVTLLPSLIRPASKGTVRLLSSDPSAPPEIDPKYLQDENDLKAFVECYKFIRKACSTGPLAEVLGEEFMDTSVPHPPNSEEYMAESIRRRCTTIYHPAGTARMGRSGDPAAVTDPWLKVQGVTGLRVADCSIMPDVVSGNTNAPAIMIGEKAASLIQAAWNLE